MTNLEVLKPKVKIKDSLVGKTIPFQFKLLLL